MSELSLYHKEHETTVRIRNKDVPYKACLEDYVLHASDETAAGSMFLYSFTRTDRTNEADRPVIFAFNGGPGSSAGWVFTGLLGPKKIKMDEAFRTSEYPEFKIVDNPECLVDIADIVIIDPIGTGNSCIVNKSKAADYYSTSADSSAFAEVIRKWLVTNHRVGSPVYLLGESFGTIRSAILANTLMGGPMTSARLHSGIDVSGIIMLGTLLPVQPKPMWFDEFAVEKTALDLPTMAAVNWYYNHPADCDVLDFVDEAYKFSGTGYQQLSFMRNALSQQERERLEKELSYYTGLSVQCIRRKAYRISSNDYRRELLADRGLDIGAYDARFTMESVNDPGMQDPVGDDPAMGLYSAPYRKALNMLLDEYGCSDLKRDYQFIDFNINLNWKHDLTDKAFHNLQLALRRNRKMRVMITNGVYDFVTTIGQARYSAANLEADDGQVIVREYPSGHMSYVGDESYGMLTRDIRDFIEGKSVTSRI